MPQKDRPSDGQTTRHTDRQIDTQSNRQTDKTRQTRQTRQDKTRQNRQADRQIDRHTQEKKRNGRIVAADVGVFKPHCMFHWVFRRSQTQAGWGKPLQVATPETAKKIANRH